MKKNISYLVLFSLIALFSGAHIVSAIPIPDQTSQGPNLPTIGTTTNAGGNANWSNPSDILLADAQSATVKLYYNGATSKYLIGQGYGFDIPVNATINGIEVLIKKKTSVDIMGNLYDSEVKLVKDGNILSTNKAKSNGWSKFYEEEYYGNSADTWGESWTAEDINNQNFGVAFSVRQSGPRIMYPIRTAFVDYIKVKVYYTVDTIAPVITLSGSNPVNIEVGTNYTDDGAIAIDNIEGNISSSILVNNSVNTSLIGSYSVTYNVVDRAGNSAIQVVRTVNVVDTTKPVISLIGGDTSLHVGDTFTDLGTTVTDNYDTGLSAVVGGDTVDTSKPGTYTITYNIVDSSGNVADTVTRTVTVVDIVAPIITLLGNDIATIEVHNDYTDAGATASDDVDGDITSLITVVNPVNKDIIGTYTITYNIADSSGNSATEITRTVKVVDTTKPNIRLVCIDLEVCPNLEEVYFNSEYTDLGAIATDNYDTELTVIPSGTVDTSIVGDYILNYSVSDSSGNATSTSKTVRVFRYGTDENLESITVSDGALDPTFASTTYNYTVLLPYNASTTPIVNVIGKDVNSATTTINAVNVRSENEADRTTIIEVRSEENIRLEREGKTIYNIVFNIGPEPDTIAPIITLIGSSTINYTIGDTFTDQGATSTDNVDGDITAKIVTDSNVSTTTAGTYRIIYSVSDLAGNQASTTRNIIVKAKVVEENNNNQNTPSSGSPAGGGPIWTGSIGPANSVTPSNNSVPFIVPPISQVLAEEGNGPVNLAFDNNLGNNSEIGTNEVAVNNESGATSTNPSNLNGNSNNNQLAGVGAFGGSISDIFAWIAGIIALLALMLIALIKFRNRNK